MWICTYAYSQVLPLSIINDADSNLGSLPSPQLMYLPTTQKEKNNSLAPPTLPHRLWQPWHEVQ